MKEPDPHLEYLLMQLGYLKAFLVTRVDTQRKSRIVKILNLGKTFTLQLPNKGKSMYYIYLTRFLDYLATLPDVFIVSIPRALEWVKNPTTLDAINDFAPWIVTEEEDNCKNKYTCRFDPEDTPGFPSERYMTSCESCPRKYPWLGNPLGEGRTNVKANKFDRS